MVSVFRNGSQVREKSVWKTVDQENADPEGRDPAVVGIWAVRNPGGDVRCRAGGIHTCLCGTRAENNQSSCGSRRKAVFGPLQP